MTTRRDFLTASALAGAASLIPSNAHGESALESSASAAGTTPGTTRARPCVVSSSNGIRGVKVAYDRIVAGTDTLDAIIAGVTIQELDPDDQSVGLGGLPNAEGVVQLDASCMHGPSRRAGGVACLEGIATPSLVAKAVMDYTEHVLLVGRDAKRFALDLGFKEQNLLTEKSRQDWLRWRARQSDSDAWLDRGEGPTAWTHGTINMNAVNAAGEISSCTTTSGLAWKVPGRVGDSPIHGAGQYCDNNVGAAGATGLGELNIKTCGGFLAVEFMRTGLAPQQALLKVLERMLTMTEDRRLGPNKRPRYDMQMYAVAKDGRYAGATMYEGADFAVCDEKGARLEKCAYLFKESERPR